MFYPNMWLAVTMYWSQYIFYKVYSKRRTSLVAQIIRSLSEMQETWIEESSRLQFMGLQRVRHGLVTKQQQL